MKRRLAVLLVGVLVPAAVYANRGPQAPAPRDAAEIQAMVDAAADGAEVVPPPGHYLGHVVVNKPITLDGRDQVTIDAGGSGTVVVVETNNAVVRNLHLTNSGADHNAEDAGVHVRGNNNVIKDNVIDETLEGVNLSKADGNIVRRNRISSKSELPLGLRGDGLKLWYSNDNAIEENDLVNSRDLVVWYSQRNRIARNVSHGGRYGLHFMYAGSNIVDSNRFFDNSVGISMMYSEGVVVKGNYIASSTGATGTCIAAKESSDLTVENNDIIYCAQGLFLDVSPYQPDSTNRISNNRFRFNDIAVGFLNDRPGNIFTDNIFGDNLTEVAVYGGGSARSNEWNGNSWDSYEGFDRDGDGIGDTPHRVFGYAGRVWMDMPNTRFFKGTATLEVLDFLDRLAPFSEPELLLEDERPHIRAKEKTS
ncbi:nitrous oxide reductase family maturation protein NosD [Magnetospirillum aberrantis SpK]|uniref:Nitrous oxide reductase family maturation protein NosD n=2 Tax=Magnetospirillum TaxID=13134 RepID=A0A7C9UXV0_9PROT|nr:nitrous oxide reductase family maturation protein NosD [Magnetospirillum aberrantis SpK]